MIDRPYVVSSTDRHQVAGGPMVRIYYILGPNNMPITGEMEQKEAAVWAGILNDAFFEGIRHFERSHQ